MSKISEEARACLEEMAKKNAGHSIDSLRDVAENVKLAQSALDEQDYATANRRLLVALDELSNAMFWNAMALHRELRTYKAAAANFDQSSTSPSTGESR